MLTDLDKKEQLAPSGTNWIPLQRLGTIFWIGTLSDPGRSVIHSQVTSTPTTRLNYTLGIPVNGTILPMEVQHGMDYHV